MEKKLHVLIVEDLPSDAELAERELRTVLKNYTVQVVETEEGFTQSLRTFKPDLIISDYQMPKFDGLSALKIIQEKSPLTPFVILTGSMNEATAVECMKAGADDYVIKEHIKRLGLAALNAMEKKKNEQERKQAEEEARKMHRGLVEAHEKLQQAYKGEKQLRDKLVNAEKLVSLGQMGAKIAHEISNPLTVISGRAQLNLMGEIDEKLKKTFEIIIRESNRIQNITSTYRNLSRPTPPKLENVNMNAILEECVEDLKITGVIKHYEVNKNLLPDLPEIIGDRDRLVQVFRNLIVNASHAMADSEEKVLTLRSSVSKDGKFAEVSIQDTGCGIEKEKLEKIFEVYYTTKPDGLGTGLGLVVVKDIVEKQHKGKVLVESEPGKGTTFTVRLPLKVDRERKKILIADDEAYIREIFTRFFEDKGLEVFTAVNGVEALDSYTKIQPDIVLFDINMPIMNGFELAEKIRVKNPKQKIVLMTGLYYETSIKERLEKANIPFFTKPADLNDVWEIVSEELKKSETS